jgi:hypothetical protein
VQSLQYRVYILHYLVLFVLFCFAPRLHFMLYKCYQYSNVNWGAWLICRIITIHLAQSLLDVLECIVSSICIYMLAFQSFLHYTVHKVEMIFIIYLLCIVITIKVKEIWPETMPNYNKNNNKMKVNYNCSSVQSIKWNLFYIH